MFDVLAHIAYALPPLTREERANRAKLAMSTHFNSKQQAFLDFVLSHYVSEGFQELDREKLTPLLKLKYHNAISDAVADLGRPEEIGHLAVIGGVSNYPAICQNFGKASRVLVRLYTIQIHLHHASPVLSCKYCFGRCLAKVVRTVESDFLHGVCCPVCTISRLA